MSHVGFMYTLVQLVVTFTSHVYLGGCDWSEPLARAPLRGFLTSGVGRPAPNGPSWHPPGCTTGCFTCY
jgi:hypothetical protein